MAIALLEKAKDVDPDYLQTRFLLGEVYATLKKYDEAIAEYKKAFELSPDNHRVAMLLVALYLGKEGL